MSARRVVFALVALAGLIDLPQPLEGDQSLFLVGAEEMARGAVLYRDFWDLKQPGIFDFYYLAGIVGGFNALAVHALELIYMLTFALVITFALSRSKALAPAATVAPLFAIALYYISSGSVEQIQVEALAGFPLFVLAWLACEATQRAGRTRHIAFALAGIAAGCALVLKLVFLPLVVALFFTAVAFPSGTYRPAIRSTMGAAALFAAGALVPIAAALSILAHGGALEAAFDTWILVPPQIVATLPAQKIGVLASALTWFFRAFGTSIVLAGAGIAMLLRAGKTDALARCLMVWLVIGAATIVAQRTSWWGYQWILESVPLGIFAAFALATLVRAPRGVAKFAFLALAAVFFIAGPVRSETHKLFTLAQHRLAVTASDRERFRRASSLAYAGVSADAASLPKGSDVYVIGNPMYYVATGTIQPLVLNGWSTELLVKNQRAELLREFEATPPQYVYVSSDDADIVMRRSPELRAYFERTYGFATRGTFGTLFRQRH